MLDRLPEELIRQIIQLVSPTDTILCVDRLSKKFNTIAQDPFLWKLHCRHSFEFWQPEHGFTDKLRQPAASVEWRQLWIQKEKKSRKVAWEFNGILSTKIGRFERYGNICRLRNDARDYLQQQCQVDDTAEDCLMRRWYARTALASINRSFAIQEWLYATVPEASELSNAFPQGLEITSRRAIAKLDPERRRVDLSLERGLAAFDLFFTKDATFSLERVTTLLDSLIDDFLKSEPRIRLQSPRQQALTLLTWTRERNLTGMEGEEANYRALRNCLIGHALLADSHPSLPLVSSAIYTCLAQRLGLDAACCLIPGHVHAIITAGPEHDLDGEETRPYENMTKAQRMFLDPYRSSHEVSLSDLRRLLVSLQWSSGGEDFLVPASVTTIVLRLAANLQASHNEWITTRNDALFALPDGTLLRGNVAPYAAAWAGALKTPLSQPRWDHSLKHFLVYFAQNFPEDNWIVRDYLLPLYNTFTDISPPRARTSWENVGELLGMLRNLDYRSPKVNRRWSEDIHRDVEYKVGQVFRHKRYEYIAIINGWGERGLESLPTSYTLDNNETADLIGATNEQLNLRQKTFYTCLRGGTDRHVVMQSNIEIITDPNLIPQSLMEAAGKMFKRFNRETCTFVSNIRELYPDD